MTPCPAENTGPPRAADKRTIHRKPQKGHDIRVTCLGWQAVLQDVRQAQCHHFVAYLKELQKHFGKVVMICDRAPQHRSKMVREFLHTNKNIRIMYFPKGSPVPERRGRSTGVRESAGCWSPNIIEHFRHVQGHLYLLSNNTVPSGIDQLCKQKNRVASHELMIFAIDVPCSSFSCILTLWISRRG